MGLDMYLTARKSSYKSYAGTEDDGPRKAMLAVCEELELPDIGNIDSITVGREVGYWRKANQIHNWFVNHCQDDRDECQETIVYAEQLAALRDLCKRLLVNKSAAEAARELETASGFFFGSTEIDQYYWDDLQNTVTILDRALSIPGEVGFTYRSSW